MGAQGTARIPVEDLRKIAGRDHIREAEAGDAVDGIMPALVVEPASIAEVSEVMKLASREGLKVAPRGSGTKMGWGNPPEALGLILSTRRLNRVLEHAAGDLVVRVEAGVELESLQRELAKAGQMLALDPLQQGATAGGIIAANASGPRRLRYGTVRDLLIGITVVLANGTVARAGGKVVKNVAGYDLAKLFTGSLGTLGVIVEAIFRLHPVPAASRTVTLEVDAPESAGAAVQALLHSPLVPSAIELSWLVSIEHGTLVVLLEGIQPGVEAQSEAAVDLIKGYGEARILNSEEESNLWRSLTKAPWEMGETGLKVNIPPAGLPLILRTIQDTAGQSGISARIAGHAGSGVLLAGLTGGDGEAQMEVIREVREAVVRAGGSLVVIEAPLAVKKQAGVWGAGGDALPLMRRVKEQFDPGGVLNPGRFIGGI